MVLDRSDRVEPHHRGQQPEGVSTGMDFSTALRQAMVCMVPRQVRQRAQQARARQVDCSRVPTAEHLYRGLRQLGYPDQLSKLYFHPAVLYGSISPMPAQAAQVHQIEIQNSYNPSIQVNPPCTCLPCTIKLAVLVHNPHM